VERNSLMRWKMINLLTTQFLDFVKNDFAVSLLPIFLSCSSLDTKSSLLDSLHSSIVLVLYSYNLLPIIIIALKIVFRLRTIIHSRNVDRMFKFLITLVCLEHSDEFRKDIVVQTIKVV